MTYDESRRSFTAKVNHGALKAVIDFNRIIYDVTARRCKVSKGTIGNLMSGKRTTVNPETAAKIEKGFNVSPGTFFSLVPLVDSTVTTRRAA